MDLNEFLPIFIESQQKVSLNNNLNRDIYSFSNKKIQNIINITTSLGLAVNFNFISPINFTLFSFKNIIPNYK